jgi:hypothetical protein
MILHVARAYRVSFRFPSGSSATRKLAHAIAYYSCLAAQRLPIHVTLDEWGNRKDPPLS